MIKRTERIYWNDEAGKDGCLTGSGSDNRNNRIFGMAAAGSGRAVLAYYPTGDWLDVWRADVNLAALLSAVIR